MATPLLGTGYGLEIDTVTDVDTAERGVDANYDLVSCATETGLDYTVDETDTSNKCDDGSGSSIPGLSNWTINWNGQAVSLANTETATKVNYQKLLQLAIDKTVFFARLISTTDPDYIREGKVYITSFNETQGNQAVFTVTATFKGTGKLFNSPAPVTP